MQLKNKHSFHLLKVCIKNGLSQLHRSSEQASVCRGPLANSFIISFYVSTPILTLRTPSSPCVSRLKVILREKIDEGLVVASSFETKRPFHRKKDIYIKYM